MEGFMLTTSLIITAVSLLFTFAILGLVFFMVYKKIWQPMQESKRLLQTGLPGKAKVLGLAETGVTVNNRPQVKILLEVTPDGRMGRSFQAEAKMLMSLVQIPQFQPGARLLVRYDPNNPQQVAIAGIDTSAIS
jgi:hypothetical protein